MSTDEAAHVTEKPACALEIHHSLLAYVHFAHPATPASRTLALLGPNLSPKPGSSRTVSHINRDRTGGNFQYSLEEKVVIAKLATLSFIASWFTCTCSRPRDIPPIDSGSVSVKKPIQFREGSSYPPPIASAVPTPVMPPRGRHVCRGHFVLLWSAFFQAWGCTTYYMAECKVSARPGKDCRACWIF